MTIKAGGGKSNEMTTAFQRQLLTVLTSREDWVSSNKEPHAFASEAGTCSRKLALRLLDTEEEADPTDSVGTSKLHYLLAGELGKIVHQLFQRTLKQTYPDFQAELKWSLGYASGRADGVYAYRGGGDLLMDRLIGQPTVVEIKTQGQWAYHRAHKYGKPSNDHILQAQLSARALKAKVVHIIYLNRALDAKLPPVMEWFFEADYDEAETELLRMKGVVQQVKDHTLPARWYEGEIVENPDKRGYPCQWCPNRGLCIAVGAEECKIDTSEPGVITIHPNTVEELDVYRARANIPGRG